MKLRILLTTLFALNGSAAEFKSTWSGQNDATWLGPSLWANPMEDWQIANGRLECIRSGANRNVHCLTHRLQKDGDHFTLTTALGQLGNGKGSAGFRLGIKSDLGDYRSALLFGKGLDAGITSDGLLFIGSPRGKNTVQIKTLAAKTILVLDAKVVSGEVVVTLMGGSVQGDAVVKTTLPLDAIAGNVALVNNYGSGATKGKGRNAAGGAGTQARYWFSEFSIQGSMVSEHPDDGFGPIWWANHSVNEQVMKLTAQMPPIGEKDSQEVTLELNHGEGFKKVASAAIDPLARTARFRVEPWIPTKEVPYRITYDWQGKTHDFTGTIRKEPTGRPLVVAGFTGNTDPGFPNTDVVRNVSIHNPDLLVFTGDQLYESVGGYGIHRSPVELATLNYLRKYALWGWAFRDLTRDRPSLCFADDHDVYQGNIWGQSGREINGMAEHAQGGYGMHKDFVNMVQRTQTSHHPDPYDPTPVDQGITVYYGDFTYGGVSFAVIEDRKFKSGPEGKVNDWKGRPDHCKDPNYDVSKLDKPGLVLLGDRQLNFLENWAADWNQAYIKVVLSQTIFANLANYHGGNQQFIFADLDSNGWPQTPRNKAVKVLRKGYAFHLAGDQHLASIVHHGADTWNDAGWSFCVPSIAAGYPRSWRPDKEGRPVQNRPAPGLPNTGEYKDGLGNHLSVYAIANPEAKNRPGRLETLHDKTSGYGIVRLDPEKQTITMECWKLLFDAAHPKPEDQHPGWPRTIHVRDNFGKAPTHALGTLNITGTDKPVIEVRKADSEELVYALRIRETTFKAGVFEPGSYEVTVRDPEAGKWQTRRLDTSKAATVDFAL